MITCLFISSSVAVSASSNLPKSGVTRVSVYEGGNDMGPDPFTIPLIAQQPQQNLGEDGDWGEGGESVAGKELFGHSAKIPVVDVCV